MALVTFDGMEKFAAEGCQLVVRGGYVNTTYYFGFDSCGFCINSYSAYDV